MRKILLLTAMLVATVTAIAQDVKLPAPDMGRKSLSVIEALRTRHSVREFAATELTVQQVSDICWAACGMSRDDTHITAPSAMNRQEIRLFVFNKKGVFEYMAKQNILKEKVKGDYRKLAAGRQSYVMQAPATFVMVIDFDKMGMEGDMAVKMGCVDAGNVSENINLYCQSVGLATVPRATMDTEGISKLLGFTEQQLPIMNNPVGLAK